MQGLYFLSIVVATQTVSWAGIAQVGTSTRYWLDDPGFESRGDRDFFAPVQIGPGALSGLLYNWYRLSFPGVKQSGRGVDHPSLSIVRVKDRVELCLYSPSVPVWQVIG